MHEAGAGQPIYYKVFFFKTIFCAISLNLVGKRVSSVRYRVSLIGCVYFVMTFAAILGGIGTTCVIFSSAYVLHDKFKFFI